MRFRGALIFTAAFVALAVVAGARYQNRRVPVESVYAPSFAHVEIAPAGESLYALDARLRSRSGLSTLQEFLPDQAGVLWISLLVLIVAGFDYARPWSGRNLDLVLAQGVGWCLIGSIGLLVAADRYNDPSRRGLIHVIFAVVVALTAILLVRALGRMIAPDTRPWTPALNVRALAGVAAFTVVLSTAMPFLHQPEDSSYFTNLGGQRLRERGLLPYGDPMLTKTPGAAYAPLMYALHAGVQFVIGEPVNASSPDLPNLGPQSEYLSPSPLSSQLLLAAFQLLAAGSLFVVGRRWGGDSMGFALAALYGGSAYVLGVGGTADLIGGMTYVSHILPPAATLLAFACLDRPILSGALLAAAAGLGFYPAFMFPAWLGYQWGASPQAAGRFLAAFMAVSLVLGLWVLWASRPAEGLGLVTTILRDTLGHHTDPEGYGMSPFGLWGQQTGFLQWMLQPLSGASAMSSPFFILFCGYLIATAVMARNAGMVGLALLTATTAMGANIWKIHATATYVAWYYPFVLLGTLGPGFLVRRRIRTVDERTNPN